MQQDLHSLLRAASIEIPNGLKNPLIEDISCDSRLVKKKSLFFGLPGEKVDGGCFWPQAFAAGAIAAVIGPSAAQACPPGKDDLVVVAPSSISSCLGEAAAAFWGHPSRHINLIGVTGTNGKTTIAHLIDHLSSRVGQPSALFGTLINRWPGYEETSSHTTNFGDVLQAQLASAVAAGSTIGAMEVSSHALSQGRVAGCLFSGAIFTNLTQDHLDYHESMEAYFEAKARLFNQPLFQNSCSQAIVNIDDPWGARLAKNLGKSCWKSSLNMQTINAGDAQLFITQINIHSDFVEGVLHSPVGTKRFVSPLIGRFNLMNLLQSVGALLQQGFALDELLDSLTSFSNVPGRMERIEIKKLDEHNESPLIIIDYAHTPDGLKQALKACRSMTSQKLFCVFGCGGDRDAGKRPKMGAIASELSDYLFITSDNPRTENPQKILNDIRGGIPISTKIVEELDRELAIQKAIFHAKKGDVVLIAGKGHENYQILGSKTIHFDDRQIARKILFQKDRA